MSCIANHAELAVAKARQWLHIQQFPDFEVLWVNFGDQLLQRWVETLVNLQDLVDRADLVPLCRTLANKNTANLQHLVPSDGVA